MKLHHSKAKYMRKTYEKLCCFELFNAKTGMIYLGCIWIEGLGREWRAEFTFNF